ncbi:RNA polymerase sigma factor [Phytoactinopolyspora halotolerans]|uniref:RNA polymerase sigma factor n=1 Tax=Phytoactinopolyspora halotolerans TaxID=1981512 RepID=UPI001C201692|nr:sigma-70 family RNA polymerase sigma factor [Phytoactinopolyspora halotolerans]
MSDPARRAIEELLRELAPQVLGTLVRRWGDFDAAEDALQEAMLSAATQWPAAGTPRNPRGWLVTVAGRRLTDELRRDAARRRREATAAAMEPSANLSAPAADDEQAPAADDTLELLFLCCHPALTPESQVALTLRAVGGLTTAQIARAFLVPDATMTRRISRAKRGIADAGATFGSLSGRERAERLRAVLHVLYLIFNEGYTASSGASLQRAELTGEAIRLTRQMHRLLPDDGEVTGLLALMLLIDARSPARTAPDGSLVPLAEQNRDLWKADQIQEGVALVTEALPRSMIGPYQIQAAVAAVHAEVSRAEDTDWPQILELYRLLERTTPDNPMVTLNHAVARAMVEGPEAGLEMLDGLDSDGRLAGHHRLSAVRAHLLELAGDVAAAREHYQLAAKLTTSLPERRYLQARVSWLAHASPDAGLDVQS